MLVQATAGGRGPTARLPPGDGAGGSGKLPLWRRTGWDPPGKKGRTKRRRGGEERESRYPAAPMPPFRPFSFPFFFRGVWAGFVGQRNARSPSSLSLSPLASPSVASAAVADAPAEAKFVIPFAAGQDVACQAAYRFAPHSSMAIHNFSSQWERKKANEGEEPHTTAITASSNRRANLLTPDAAAAVFRVVNAVDASSPSPLSYPCEGRPRSVPTSPASPRTSPLLRVLYNSPSRGPRPVAKGGEEYRSTALLRILNRTLSTSSEVAAVSLENAAGGIAANARGRQRHGGSESGLGLPFHRFFVSA